MKRAKISPAVLVVLSLCASVIGSSAVCAAETISTTADPSLKRAPIVGGKGSYVESKESLVRPSVRQSAGVLVRSRCAVIGCPGVHTFGIAY